MGMEIQIAILSIAMVLLLAILFRLRLARGPSEDNRLWDRRAVVGANHPFHAVSISPVPSSCSASQAMRSLRFLSEEAPSLPLVNCGAQECQCRYVHYPDRRGAAGDRRLGPVEESEESEYWSLRNRRSFLGRRLAEKQPA